MLIFLPISFSSATHNVGKQLKRNFNLLRIWVKPWFIFISEQNLFDIAWDPDYSETVSRSVRNLTRQNSIRKTKFAFKMPAWWKSSLEYYGIWHLNSSMFWFLENHGAALCMTPSMASEITQSVVTDIVLLFAIVLRECVECIAQSHVTGIMPYCAIVTSSSKSHCLTHQTLNVLRSS